MRRANATNASANMLLQLLAASFWLLAGWCVHLTDARSASRNKRKRGKFR